MKKSMALIILAIFFGSVLYVSYFGMHLRVHGEIIPVKEVECTNTDIEVNAGEKDILLIFNDPRYYTPDSAEPNNPLKGTFSYTISYVVRPENATDKKVNFLIESDNDGIVIKENGLEAKVEITKPFRSYRICLMSNDQPSIKDTIYITTKIVF